MGVYNFYHSVNVFIQFYQGYDLLGMELQLNENFRH